MRNRESFLRKEVVRIGKFLYDRGLIVASDGNISVRLNKNLILITQAGYCKGRMKSHEIVRMDMRGKSSIAPAKLKPSSEYPMHLALYEKRAGINAVIHAHPAYTTALASAKTTIKQRGLAWFFTLPEIKQTVGKIGSVDVLPPGSQDLASAVAHAITKTNACLMANHGLVAVGEDLTQALYRLERIEFAAKIFLLAHLYDKISDNLN